MAALSQPVGGLKFKKEESVKLALLSKNPAGQAQTGERCAQQSAGEKDSRFSLTLSLV